MINNQKSGWKMKEKINLEKDDIVVILVIIVVIAVAYGFFKLFYSVPG